MTNGQPPSLKTAARTLLIVLLVIIGVFIYAYGWDTTNINLEAPQDENRQDSVKRSIRELLSPNIFDQDFKAEQTALANFQRGCIEDEPVESIPRESGAPYIEVSPQCGGNDEPVKVVGRNFDFHSRNVVRLTWIAPGSDTRAEETISLINVNLKRDGSFEAEVIVPRIRASQGALHIVQAEVFEPSGSIKFSDTSKTVWDKMIETIFLALMATTLAIPIATVLSFLAARNLMRQVMMPVGNVLVSLILLPIGWYIGMRFFGPLGTDGVRLGSVSEFHLIGQHIDLSSIHPLPSIFFPIVLLAGAFVGTSAVTQFIYSGLGDDTIDYSVKHFVNFIKNIVWIMVGISSFGILGGLLIYIGTELTNVDILQSLGLMLSTIGELFKILAPLFAGLGVALVTASTGSAITVPILKPIRGGVSHAIGAILGAAVGAILMGIFTALSVQAALLVVFSPLIAAVLGWQIATNLYRAIRSSFASIHDTSAEDVLLTILGIVGAVLAFVAAYLILNVGRGLLDGRRPLTEEISILGLDMRLHVFYGIVFGGVLGAINWGLIGIQASMPLGLVVYNSVRTTLNILRSIEPLMMGIVFVIWVGAGPFAGVLALTLHSIAALGKLYSEQVENIDAGPIEAIQSTGANRLQTIVYAVVPQIVPPYIAFTLYRWDINVRMSTIIGFVGGGGIGFILQQQINLLRYQEAGVALLAIAFVVSVLDYTSAFVRARMI